MRRVVYSFGVGCFLILQGSPSNSADSPVDLDAYCRSVHGDRAFQTIDRRDNGFLCTVGMGPGPGMTHHKMWPADACAALFGTTLFRREGEKIICAGVDEGRAGGGSKQIDLSAYCLSEFGEHAEVTRNNVNGAAMCTIRTDGGLGMLHNIIDVSGLCPAGFSAGPVTGTMLTCLSRNAAGSGTASGGPVNRTGRGNGSSQTTQATPRDKGPVAAGEPYSGGIVTAEIWRGLEGEASYFPWLDLRIERDGDVIEAYVSPRHDNRCASSISFKLGDDCRWDDFGIVPDTLVLAGVVRNDRITGRTRLTMSYVALPLCISKYEQILDDPSSWIDFTGRIEADEVQVRLDPEAPRTFLPYVAPRPDAVPECRLVPLVENGAPPDPEAPAANVGNPPQNTHGIPPLEFVNSIRFQRLSSGPNVVEIVFVERDPPFSEIENVEKGQEIRVRVTLDRDAPGHIVEVSAGDEGSDLLMFDAVCGDLNPAQNLCFTDPIVVGQ